MAATSETGAAECMATQSAHWVGSLLSLWTWATCTTVNNAMSTRHTARTAEKPLGVVRRRPDLYSVNGVTLQIMDIRSKHREHPEVLDA